MTSKVKQISFNEKVKWLRDFFCNHTFTVYDTIDNISEDVTFTKFDTIDHHVGDDDYIAKFCCNDALYSYWIIFIDIYTFNMIGLINNNRFKVRFAGRHNTIRLYIEDIGESCLNDV